VQLSVRASWGGLGSALFSLLGLPPHRFDFTFQSGHFVFSLDVRRAKPFNQRIRYHTITVKREYVNT